MNYEDLITDYLQRVDQGKTADPQEYITRHPQYSDRLQRFFSNLGVMNERIEKIAPEPSPDLTSTRKTIGDFRLVRELGRGGMGIVYEAEQLSTDRRVALKTLPLAGLVDESRIRRFRNEVRAVAALDHPNIVTVHTVGEERGVHYFAMQLIRGRSLSEVISSLKQVCEGGKSLAGDSVSLAVSSVVPDLSSAPDETEAFDSSATSPAGAPSRTVEQGDSGLSSNTGSEYFRSVASLGVQAASAIQHAHDQGVIHRDIKPANLLLDASSNLYVTDFGLARIETDAGMTATGSLLGTLRYMAPEQALAKRVTVDHRADIYSLGATLYELLSLQPAYSAVDRQHLLKQIAFEDPKPLQSLDANIPTELGVIVQKAMSKDMEDRYSTSEELAEDLRRFLEHRPIQAKPPTLPQRISKWSRRNPRLMWTALTSLTLVTIAFAISTLMVTQQRDAAVASLYVSEMNQAFQAWNRGNSPRTHKLLAKQIPSDNSADLRGVEWYFLAGRCRTHRGEHLIKHTNPVRILSPNHELLYTQTEGDLVVQDLKTKKRSVLFENITTESEQVRAVSADGQRVAVKTKDGFRIVDVAAKNSRTIEAKNAWYVRFSHDGKLGAHADEDGNVYLWDAETGEIAWSKMLLENDAELSRVLFTPNDKLLITVFQSPNHLVALDLATKETRSVKFGLDELHGFKLLNDDSMVLSGYGAPGTIYVDISDGGAGEKPLWLPPTRYVVSLDISPDERLIALGTESNAIEVWDTTTRQLVWRQLRGRRIDTVAFVGEGKLLVDTGGDMEVCDLFKASTVTLNCATHYYKENCLDIFGNEIAFAGPSQQIVFWEPDRDQTRVFDFSKDLTDVPALTRNRIVRIVSAPDRSKFACVIDGVVRIWDGKREVVHRINDRDVYQVAYSPDGKWFGLAGTSYLTILDTRNHKTHWEHTGTEGPTHAISFSPDGNWLAEGGGPWQKSGYLNLWRISGENFELVNESDAHQEAVVWTGISPDSRWLAAGDMSGQIVIYDLRTAEAARTINAHPMAVLSLDFSPDGKRLVSSSVGSIKFWQVGTWEELGEMTHTKNPVHGVRFFKSRSKGLGLIVGHRPGDKTAPATQEVYWLDQDADWSWLK